MTPSRDKSYERSAATHRCKSHERHAAKSHERQIEKLRNFELSVQEERKENFAVPCTPKAVRGRRPITIGASPTSQKTTLKVKTPPMSSLLGTTLSSRFKFPAL